MGMNRQRLAACASCVEDMDNMDVDVEKEVADHQEGSPSEPHEEALPWIVLPRSWSQQLCQCCHFVLDQ